MATESGSAAGDQPETTGAPHPSAHASPSPLPTGTVTFLFTDIEGSTERWEHHRDAMRATLERHDAVVRGAIESHGGHVLKTVGDAFCAAFHTPLAAVAAALDAQRAVAAEDWSACGADFAPLRVRIGIHTGVAQERGGDYFGPAVNRTARLEAAGHGGQVLMSLATQQLVQGDLPADCTVRDWGTHRLKDLRYADRIFQVVGPGVADVATPPRTATALAPRDRVVFSCRTLDYSAPLSTPALRVSQVQIEPMSDRQVEEFLTLYSPVRGADIWAAIRGTPQIDALRAPFFLALLVDQVESTGEIAGDRAGLFTGFVRQALRREVERGSPLFALEELLSGRDVRRIAQWQWRDAYELPERGALVPRLSALAYGMQETEADGEASQVRVDYDAALEIVDDPRAEDIVKAGVSIAVFAASPAEGEVL